MADAYIGEIRMFGGGYAPAGWLLCQGQSLSLNDGEYGPLFALIGTTYGGDGQNNFNLPNLASRVPVGQNGSTYALGSVGGTESVTLQTQHLPAHSHGVPTATTPGLPSPSGGNLADAKPTATLDEAMYSTAVTPLVSLTGGTVSFSGGSASGGSAPHANIQPSVGLCFIICFAGIYPPRPPQA